MYIIDKNVIADLCCHIMMVNDSKGIVVNL